MYIPIGDRVLVTKHTITEEIKTQAGIILPEGFQHDEDPPDLLRVEAKGNGPACKFIEVGDMILLQPHATSFLVYTSREEQLKYYIVNAAVVLGRAKMVRDEIDAEA